MSKPVQCYEGDGDLPLLYQVPIPFILKPTDYRHIEEPWNRIGSTAKTTWGFELEWDFEISPPVDLKKLAWKLRQAIGKKVAITIDLIKYKHHQDGILECVQVCAPMATPDEPMQWNSIHIFGRDLPPDAH